MSRPSHDDATGRRDFLRLVGFAGLLGALPAAGALAQTAAPPAPSAPASPALSAPPAPEISEDARALAAIVQRRHGAHLDAAQLEAVTRDLERVVQNGRRLRAAKLVNADEPDATFRA
jgi:hypothetical protein